MCKIKHYSQKDKRWENDKIGDTDFRMGRYGCLVSSITTLGSWYCSDWTPKEGAKNFKFTDKALLIWNSVTEADFPMRFVKRYYGNSKKITEIIKSKDNSVVIQVNGNHWLAGLGISSKGVVAYDPYYDDVVAVNTRYNITGFAEFTRKEKNMYGVDISHWNKVNWDKLNQDFIIIKATQGTSYIDHKFEFNQKKAREKGMKIGYYHYMDDNDPKQQAKFFKETVKALKGEFLVLDMEVHIDNVKSKIKKFFKELGGEKILYTGDNFLTKYKLQDVADYFWVARYGQNTGEMDYEPKNNWDMWQYTSRGKVAGIEGNADLNITSQLPKGVDNCDELKRKYKEAKANYLNCKKK